MILLTVVGHLICRDQEVRHRQVDLTLPGHMTKTRMRHIMVVRMCIIHQLTVSSTLGYLLLQTCPYENDTCAYFYPRLLL